MIKALPPTLESIREKVEAGERLSFEEGLFLDSPAAPLNEVADLANLVRERKNGHFAYYNINTHLNPTNVCVYRCTFCAFRSDLRDPKGYAMSDEQILERGREAVESGCTEMHIVGGLHHQRKYDWYRNIIAILHEAYPALHLKAWTAVEINWFQHLTGWNVRQILEDMRRPAWAACRGVGPRSFIPRCATRSASTRPTPTTGSTSIARPTNWDCAPNCTMLYGHIEKSFHRVDHLIRLRELQDETGGFQTFIPLAFHPDNTGLSHVRKPSSVMDLRTMAVSRLMLDNIDHIKAYWIMLGVGTAQTALPTAPMT